MTTVTEPALRFGVDSPHTVTHSGNVPEGVLFHWSNQHDMGQGMLEGRQKHNTHRLPVALRPGALYCCVI